MKNVSSKKIAELITFVERTHLTLKENWSNIFYIFFRDLKRLVTNPIATFVIIFILFFPCLYAWIGTSAYWDPYSHTDKLKIAIVNEDKPADTGIAGEIDLGSMIVDALQDIPILAWDFTNREDAIQKLDDGTVYSAIMIPSDFSKNFSILFNDSQKRTNIKFEYYINERENGAAVKIFDIASSTIEGQINQKFINAVSDILSKKAHELTGDVSKKASDSTKSISQKVSSAANDIENLTKLLDSGRDTINQVNNTIQISKSLITDIKAETSSVLNSVNICTNTCNALRARVQQAYEELQKKWIDAKIILEILHNLESSIDQNLTALNSLSEIMYKINSICDEINMLISQIENILNSSNRLTENFADKINKVYNKLSDLSNVIDGDIASTPFVIKTIIDSNTENLSTFMSTPVSMDNHIINEVKCYGLGGAPFFSNLTLWIAALVLVALFRTEVDPPKRKNFNTRQAYISRGMLFSVVAILQGIVCAIGDFVIGVECVNPGLFVLTCVIASFTYSNIIYMLAACFKHIGKAIAVVLIIMQIPGSSGMYPVAMMPASYQFISPFLPFTYGISAMRECIVSLNIFSWSWDIFALLIYVLISFLIGIYAREHLVNINKLFDRKLAKTGLMECDANDHLVNKNLNAASLIELLEKSEVDTELIKQLKELKLRYKKRKKLALFVLWVFPTALLISFSVIFTFVSVEINTKIILLMLWLLVIIACCSIVIVLEFKQNRFKKQYNELYEMQSGLNN